jgi:hypothetical protein
MPIFRNLLSQLSKVLKYHMWPPNNKWLWIYLNSKIWCMPHHHNRWFIHKEGSTIWWTNNHNIWLINILLKLSTSHMILCMFLIIKLNNSRSVSTTDLPTMFNNSMSTMCPISSINHINSNERVKLIDKCWFINKSNYFKRILYF